MVDLSGTWKVVMMVVPWVASMAAFCSIVMIGCVRRCIRGY